MSGRGGGGGKSLEGRMFQPDDGSAPYQRGYEPSLMFIDGQEYSFEEIRSARNCFLGALGEADIQAIKGREQELVRAKSSSNRAALAPAAHVASASSSAAGKLRVAPSSAANVAGNRVPIDKAVVTLEAERESSNKRKRDKENILQFPQQPDLALNGANDDNKGDPLYRDTKRPRLNTAVIAPSTPKQAPRQQQTVLASFTASSATMVPASPTVTINTKNALAKINSMFSGGMTETINTKSCPSPTMTMNSKVAAADVAAMFAGPLSHEKDSDKIGKTQQAEPLVRRTGLAPLTQEKKPMTYGDIIAQRLNNRPTASMFVTKKQEEEEEEFVDTGVITGVITDTIPAMSVGGFAVFEDNTTGTLPRTTAPKQGGFQIYSDDKEDEYLAADDVSHFSDNTSSTFGPTDSMPAPQKTRAPAFQIFEEPESPVARPPQKRAAFAAAATPSPRRPISSRRSPAAKQMPPPAREKPTGETIDPFDPAHIEQHVAMLMPQIRRYDGFIDCHDAKAPGAKLLKTPKNRRVSTGGQDPTLKLKGLTLEVERQIGAGAFATVWLVEKISNDGNSDGTSYALKVQAPPSLWEWYMLNQIQQRVDHSVIQSFIRMESVHLYQDKGIILMNYYPYSLQDIISEHKKSQQAMDEALIVYFCIEIMKSIMGLHKANIIHGDIKPDNILFRLDNMQNFSNWGSGAEGGWDSKGVTLIDFGKSIDLTLYPPNITFVGDSGAEQFRCAEMREGRPWKYQGDCFAFCGVVHCLLHMNYMNVVPDGGRWKPKEAFKRWWQGDALWKPLFDYFLNYEDNDNQPDWQRWIDELERYLLNSGKASHIRTLLSRVNNTMFRK